MRLRLRTAWKQVWPLAGAEGDHPLSDRAARLRRDLELHGTACLFLDDRRSVANPSAGTHVIDPQPHQVAASELAIDGQIEHRKIALTPLQLEANANDPDVLRPQGALLSDQPSLVPGCALLRGSEILRHR